MIIKMNGIPVKEVSEQGVEVAFKLEDAWDLMHTPVNLDVGIHGHSVAVDLNAFNVPSHFIGVIKPHFHTIIDHLF